MKLVSALLRLRTRARAGLGFRPRRVAFLHIPKCAGSSVNAHFKANYGSQRSGRSVFLDSAGGTASDPMTRTRARAALFISGHFDWETLEHIKGDAITLTVLRDPFERLRSLFLYSREQGASSHWAFTHLAQRAKVLEFASFCASDDIVIRAFVDNAITRTLAQTYYPFAPADATTLAAAQANLAKFDVVLDSARLGEGLLKLATLTETRVPAPSQRSNVTRDDGAGVMSRDEFLSQPRLRRVIEFDTRLYDAHLL